MRTLIFAALITFICGCNTAQVINTGMQVASAAQIDSPDFLKKGVRETLALSSQRATASLSKPGAYASSNYRIGLPQEFDQAIKLMKQFGFDKQVQKVENQMNRGAELAAAESQAVILNTIQNMNINDAIGIIQGGDTAATDFLQRSASASLKSRYQEIVTGQLKKLGYYQEYQQLMGLYKNIPLVQKPKLDIEDMIVDRGLTALFSQIAKEEKLIRQDPVGNGSALIASVLSRK